jgi:methionyl-tRNA formyltransferase
MPRLSRFRELYGGEWMSLIIASRSDYKASSIFSSTLAQLGHPHYRAGNNYELQPEKGDTIVFGFWSWLIQKDALENCDCISFHAADLPHYRGGSPIQHQIIDGWTATKLTAFRPTEAIDAGPIFLKKTISLEGDLGPIMERIGTMMAYMTAEIIEQKIEPEQQALDGEPFNKRRTPDMSEIKLDMTAIDAYNLVRCLNMEPYPAAFIRMKDGKKLKILKAEVEEC